MKQYLILIGALINSLICFSLAITSVPFEKIITPTPTVYHTRIVLPTIIPTATPIPIPTENPFQGEAYQHDLFSFLFDFSNEHGLVLDQEYTDLISDDGTRTLYVRFINPEAMNGEMGLLRYSVVIFTDYSKAVSKYDESYKTITSMGEFTLISEFMIMEDSPVALFVKEDFENGYELRFITRTKNIYIDSLGSTTISDSVDRETTLNQFMELMNNLQFQALDKFLVLN